MSDELYAAIALAVAIAAGTITYKKCRSKGTRKNNFIERAKLGGYYTSADYVDSKVLLGNSESSDVYFRSKSLKCKYKYQVNGSTYYKYMTFQSPGKVSVDFPISTTVYYDPKNPKKAVCHEEATNIHRLRYAGLTAICVSFLTLFCVFHILRFIFK